MTPPPLPATRILGFWVGYFAILILTGVAKGMLPPRWGPLAWGALSTALLLVLTLVLLKRERRAPADVGLGIHWGSGGRLGVGIALGLVLYAAILLGDRLLAGPITLTRDPGATFGGVVLTVATYLALAAMEELGFRGYPLRSLVPAMGLWPAQLVVAAAFGLSHLAYGWSWSAILLGVLPSGLLFGFAATRSGGLALPIGIHAGVNLAAWAVGAKEGPGLWTISVEDAVQSRLDLVAPAMGVGLTLLLALALARRPAPEAS